MMKGTTNKYLLLLFFIMGGTSFLAAQQEQTYRLQSPDAQLQVEVSVGGEIRWTLHHEGKEILAPSAIALELAGAGVLGQKARVKNFDKKQVRETIEAVNYKKEHIQDHYNELTLKFRKDFGITFRAYDAGVAYRFFLEKKCEVTVVSEQVAFNFAEDHMIYIPYVNNPQHDRFQSSYENRYHHVPISKINRDSLGFAPVLVEFPGEMKVAITEADLESYPGMFLEPGVKDHSLKGVFAPYPLEEERGGHANAQSFVTKRADYIAKTSGDRSLPWRLLIVSEEDKELLNNDMVYQLAAPSRIKDPSWIKPGKVAWDWWNAWNISDVDFRAGVNTQTYKYYTDFAAEYGIENILLDEGWAPRDDFMTTIPEIDLQEIIDYAAQRNVGVWIWGGYLPISEKMEEAVSTYSEMGVKGFKVDFMDRDDQKMVDFYYRLAKMAAEHELMVDFHGSYKPTGLQRTYPNVVNFEGVYGLENAKWANPDFPKYDTQIPFIRMLAGPMDYTPGAMKNANKENFRSIFSAPMSQGTRVHQLALYVLYEAPFNMLADNPTNYQEEEESARFIASVPTTFDETVAMEGKVGEYAAIARRKGDTWYVGAITNWDARELELDFSFLPNGEYEAVIFKDGINADRDGTDYVREETKVSSGEQLKVKLKEGGGWAARISPVE